MDRLDYNSSDYIFYSIVCLCIIEIPSRTFIEEYNRRLARAFSGEEIYLIIAFVLSG